MSSNSLGKRKTRKRMKKVLITSFLAVILAVSTSLPGMMLGSGNSDNVAHAESLADVNLLQGVTVDATLGNVEGEGDYTLNLKLARTGVADVELINPDHTFVFDAKELARDGKWHVDGKAHVEAKLLPITLADIPAVGQLLDGLTGTLNTTLNLLIGTVDELNENVIKGLLPVLDIKNLDKLQNAIAALGNLDEALVDLTLYEDDITVEVGDNGELKVNFSDALGNRLETAVNKVVVGLLQDVIAAANALDIDVDLSALDEIPIVGQLPILGQLLGVIGDTLDFVLGDTLDLLLGSDDEEGLVFAVVEELTTTVEALIGQITSGVIDLTNLLASLQVLGDITIELDLTVDKPVGFSGEVKVFGEGVNTSAITLDVLSSFVNYDTIVFNEKAPEKPEPPKTEKPDPEPEEPKKPEKPGTKLPDTATAAGAIGLTGLTALLAGIATRLFGRRK